MVAAQLRCSLEVGRDVAAVDLQASHRLAREIGIEPAGITDRAQSPRPVGRPQRDLHRVHPVDADPWRIRLDPRAELTRELSEVAVVAEQGRGAAKGEQLVAAAQLPRDLRVAAVFEADRLDVLVESPRPGHAAFEVAVPVDLRPKRGRARPEQVELMGDRPLGLGADGGGGGGERGWKIGGVRWRHRQSVKGRVSAGARNEPSVGLPQPARSSPL